MEDYNRREENELTRDTREDDIAEEERGFNNHYQLMRKSPYNFKRKEMERYDRKSRSRSRSRSRVSQGQRRSTNAFINFMQDFKQNYKKMKSKDLFRLGGQRWREMSSEEKTPYVREAKLAKQQSQQNNKSDHTNKINDNNSTKKSGNQKEHKKKEREERRYSRNRMEESDMESDSATSGTAASMTSEDISDLSS